ncbi:hypothetical protein ID866_8872 [Astraeus odoratus]|nr:hypothetical protein ID866_8872 [Astraeus odoratus]
MHDPHADLFLMPAGMTQLSLSLAHLVHTGTLTWLLLTWASESAHCHFLASVAAATVCQYSCQTSSSMYMHLTLPPQPSASSLCLTSSSFQHFSASSTWCFHSHSSASCHASSAFHIFVSCAACNLLCFSWAFVSPTESVSSILVANSSSGTFVQSTVFVAGAPIVMLDLHINML